VEFVEQLPKTATGKVFWRKLQEEENRRASA
jgi:acyl-coenzyme A synthetase/AMP-(fatty) acid ligase